MSFSKFQLSNYIGISGDFLIIALCILAVILFVIIIITLRSTIKLKERLNVMIGSHTEESLENAVLERLKKIDQASESIKISEKNIEDIYNNLASDFYKIGLVKYNALEDIGGKLSFSLAMLNRKNSGFILNSVHSKEGCYTYIKEIIDGKAVLLLGNEEQEALEQALQAK